MRGRRMLRDRSVYEVRSVNRFSLKLAAYIPGSWQAMIRRRAASANSLDEVFRASSFFNLQRTVTTYRVMAVK